MSSQEHHVPPSDLAIYPVEQPAQARTLVDILEASIASHPKSIAIDNGKQRLSYQELGQEVATKAAQLTSAGVGPGDRVGIRVSSGTTELYVSILATLTSGAAYVPVDVDDPDERAELVFSEAGVCAVFTNEPTVTVMQRDISSSATRPQHRKPSPEDDAWIIFTSGSTGKPKGVAVTHRSAAAFVDAEASLFVTERPLAPGDRVLAGLSVGFDASCEEMWLAWRYGACLVPAPRSLVKAGADLGNFITAQRISVVSTVPTLAAMWPAEALGAVRLLILGGEACPTELSTRLSKAVGAGSGEVWNTYGPTEATVVSCAAQLVADKPVSIGLPLLGWKLAVVNPDGSAARWGETGELVIGGVGMARYLDLEKDKAKFAPAPVFGGERAYSSGDVVRAERDGLYFVGRADEQIKLGGRRIELGEIDAALMLLPGVSAAASAVCRSELGNQVLVGYVVRDESVVSSTSSDRELLKRVLPATLIPMVVKLDSLPVRTSGKVDRKALPWPLPASPAHDPEKGELTENDTGIWLAEQWRKVLGMMPPASSDANPSFFDIGGTSLAAAQLVSQIRERCPNISVADIYQCPTLLAMTERIDSLSDTKYEEREVALPTRWMLFVQVPIMLLWQTIEGLRWIVSLLLFKKFVDLREDNTSWTHRYGLPWYLLWGGYFLFMSIPGRMVATALCARLLTFRLRPGIYRRGSAVHIRMWAVQRFAELSRLNAIAGTQWCRYYAWMLGCQVGTDAQLHALPPMTGFAVFGDRCAVEPEADIQGWWLDGDDLHIGTITIGNGAKVGHRSTLMPNTVLEPFAVVEPGVSVQGIIRGPVYQKEPQTDTQVLGFWAAVRYTVTLLLLDILPLLPTAPVWGLAPAIVHNYANFHEFSVGLLIMVPPGTVLGALAYTLTVIILVRLSSLAIRPGVHSWNGSAAWAAWLTHFLMIDARTSVFGVFASLFTPNWLRLLGAKIGKNVEASTVVPIPSLLSVDDGSFLADDVLVAPFDLEYGSIRLGPSTVGSKAFLGNSAIVNPDTSVPDGALVSVLGTAPQPSEKQPVEPGSSWLGRPAMTFARRVETSAAASDQARTFAPPAKLKLYRSLVEVFRIVPMFFNALIQVLISIGMLYFMSYFGIGWAFLAGGAMLLVGGALTLVITTVARWVLTPKARPGDQHPLWSTFVWRNELADTFVQGLAFPWMIRHCYGTPILTFWLRTMGAKIGRGVWLESHFLPEAGLVKLGGGATVNRNVVLQTHLFHDRVMRLDRVTLGKGATLGPFAIALPGTTIGAGTTVGPTSLVMRGEQIPANSRWKGNPVRPWFDDETSSGFTSDSSLKA